MGHALLMFREITNYEVNNKYSQITLTAPANLLEEGYLVVECYTSSAVTEFKKNGPKTGCYCCQFDNASRRKHGYYYWTEFY